MSTLVRVLVAVASIGCAMAHAANRASDSETIQGRWKVINVTPKDRKSKGTAGLVLVFGSNTFYEESPGADPKTVKEAKYRLNTTKNPKQIDLLDDETGMGAFDDAKQNFIKGMYQLEGDRLTLCFATWDPDQMPTCIVGEENPRPVDFKTAVADRLTVMVLVRESPQCKHSGSQSMKSPNLPATDPAKADGVAKRAGNKTSFKGWELYIWQENGEDRFSLLEGTNRPKFPKEIAQEAVRGIGAIKAKLDELEPGQSIVIEGRGESTAHGISAAPPKKLAGEVRDYCKKLGLDASAVEEPLSEK